MGLNWFSNRAVGAPSEPPNASRLVPGPSAAGGADALTPSWQDMVRQLGEEVATSLNSATEQLTRLNRLEPGLVRSLAIEWGPAVRTVGVAPGFIDTAGNDTWFDSFPDPEAERRRTIDLHPVKRIGTVEEVGALCVYLASPYARFISGTTILMDGGRSALMQDE